jgi:hypothetical protein
LKLTQLLTVNAVLFLAFGIAFALYGPLMIAMYGILETEGTVSMYWYVASFSRMFGTALFGFGFLLWSVRHIDEFDPNDARQTGHDTRRGIVFALLLANLLGFIVAITQQSSIWGTFIGWITVGMFLLLVLGYGYFLVKKT